MDGGNEFSPSILNLKGRAARVIRNVADVARFPNFLRLLYQSDKNVSTCKSSSWSNFVASQLHRAVFAQILHTQFFPNSPQFKISTVHFVRNLVIPIISFKCSRIYFGSCKQRNITMNLTDSSIARDSFSARVLSFSLVVTNLKPEIRRLDSNEWGE